MVNKSITLPHCLLLRRAREGGKCFYFQYQSNIWISGYITISCQFEHGWSGNMRSTATIPDGMFISEWSLSFQLPKTFRWPGRIKCIISCFFIFIKTVWTWKWRLMVPFSIGWRSLGVSVQKEKTMCNPSGTIIERNSVVITALHWAGGCYKYWNRIW